MNSITPSPSSLHHSNFSSPNPSQFPLKPPKTLHFFYNPTTSLHSQTQTPLLLSRRLFLPSVSGIWDALTGNNNNDPARQAVVAVRRGMHLFREGDVSGSVMEFDRAIELDPRQKACLKRRRSSFGVAQNPNDTEESMWCFLCEAQLYGVDEARRRFLEVGRDPRPVMREAYAMFKDGGDPEKLVSVFSNGNDSEFFYASLYAGLYYESQRNAEGAERHIVAASQSPYAVRSNDYMASLAKVHCSCRNWRPKAQP